MIWPGVGFIFGKKKILQKPNIPEYAQVLVVTYRKLKSEKCPLRPLPTLVGGPWASEERLTRNGRLRLIAYCGVSCMLIYCVEIQKSRIRETKHLNIVTIEM